MGRPPVPVLKGQDVVPLPPLLIACPTVPVMPSDRRRIQGGRETQSRGRLRSYLLALALVRRETGRLVREQIRPAQRAAHALLRSAPLEERAPRAMALLEPMSHPGFRQPIRPDVQRRAVAS